MQEEFLEEESLGEMYMDKMSVQEEFLGDGSLGEEYMGEMSKKSFWVKSL